MSQICQWEFFGRWRVINKSSNRQLRLAQHFRRDKKLKFFYVTWNWRWYPEALPENRTFRQWKYLNKFFNSLFHQNHENFSKLRRFFLISAFGKEWETERGEAQMLKLTPKLKSKARIGLTCVEKNSRKSPKVLLKAPQ